MITDISEVQVVIKPGYKHTTFGWIPEEWDVFRLGEVTSKVGSGITPKGGSSVYQTTGIPFIRSQNVLNGHLNMDDVAFISLEQHHKMKSTWLKSFDVLLNITGASIGRCCIIPKDFHEGNVNQHVCIIRVNSRIDAFYLSIFLNSPFGQKQIDEFQAGGNREGLNFEQIKSFKIPLPPLPEQKKIAQILSIWDKAIQTTQALLTAKEQRKKYLMSQLLTGKKRFPEFEGTEWKEVALGEVFCERAERGYTNLELLAITSAKGVVKRDSLEKRDTSNEDKSKYLRIMPSDIGYNTMRMWQGVSGVSKYEGIVSPAYTIIKPISSVDVNFMSYLFKFPPVIHLFWRHSQGLVDDTLNCKFPNLAKVKVKIPAKSEQQKVASILNICDKEIQLLKDQLESFRQQKKGMMQQLLTGKVRVQTEEPGIKP